MDHRERFQKLLAAGIRPKVSSDGATAADTARAMEAAGMKFVNTNTATIYRCPICGEVGQQGYAGTPPCFETRSKRKLATLKRKGCVRGIALHTCPSN